MIPKNHFSEDIKKIMVMKLLQPRSPSVLQLSRKKKALEIAKEYFNTRLLAHKTETNFK